ncbi:unnamed protein product [Cunninghamella blakesleeana]
MLQSTRNLIHLKITLSSVLQVLIFIPEEKLNVSKKGQEAENISTISQAGEVYFTYHFKALEKHQTLIIRESMDDEITEYKPHSIYPYQLLIYIEEPPSTDKTIYNYFNATIKNHT